MRWEFRYRDANGNQHAESRRTKEAAVKAKAEKRMERLQGLVRDESKSKQTFDFYAQKWLTQTRSRVRPRTVEGYEKDLRVHVLPVFGSKPVGRITTSDVLHWVEKMQDKRIAGHSLSPRTIKAAFRRIEQVLSLAVLDGAVHINVASGVPLPRLHTEPPTKPFKWRILSLSQQGQLVSAMAYPDNLVAGVLLGTGLRAAELAGLQIGDIDLSRRTLNVERTKRYRSGRLHIAPPKTEHSERTVPMGVALANELRNWLDMHPGLGDPEAPLFPFSPDDWSQPIDMNVFRRIAFWPAVKAAGLDPALRIHDLRHTFGTTLVEAGVPIERVSRLMGHSAIQVTMLYTHLDTATYHDEIDSALPSLFEPTKTRLEVVAG